MNELLAHPAVQGAIAPLVVGLLVASLLGNRWPGGAITAAFATGAGLVIGWDLEPLNFSRKLAFVGLAAGIVVLAVAWARAADRGLVRLGASLAFGCAALWVMAGVLRQMELAAAVTAASAGALFIALLAYGPARAAQDGVRAAVSALVLSLAAGVLALLGASAVLALMAIAAGAGAGALLLLQVLGLRAYAQDWSPGMPAQVVGGLVAVMACLTGGLPWYAPAPLLAVPWAAHALRMPGRGPWVQAAAGLAGAMLPAAAALVLAIVRPAAG